MNSFFGKWYDPAKDRRYGMLFLITVAILFCLYALGAIACTVLERSDVGREDLYVYFLQGLPGFIILVSALIWRGIRRNRTRHKENFQICELSREEIRKARSKLVKTKN